MNEAKNPEFALTLATEITALKLAFSSLVYGLAAKGVITYEEMSLMANMQSKSSILKNVMPDIEDAVHEIFEPAKEASRKSE